MGGQENDFDEVTLKARIVALEAQLACLKNGVEKQYSNDKVFHQFAGLTRDAVFVQDDNRRIVYINASGVALFGAVSPDEIIGTLATSYVHPEARNAADQEYSNVLNGTAAVELNEQPWLRVDGVGYIADVSAKLIEWAEKPAVLTIVRNVSDRIRAQEKLETLEAQHSRSEQRLREAIDAMSEGFALFDAEDRLQIFNERYAEDVWSSCPEEVQIGRSFDELVDAAMQSGIWDGADLPRDEIAQKARERHNNLPSVSEILYPSGRWKRQSKKRTREGGVVGVYSDLTEIKQREERLRYSENLHRELLETLPDAVFIHIDEKIVFVNAAAVRLFGAESVDQLIGKDSLSFVPEEDRALQLERRKTVLKKHDQLDPAVQRRVRLDGSIVDVETVATFIDWEGVPAFLGVVRDISARKAAKAAYAETERRFSAVTDNMPGAVFQRVMEPSGKLSFSYTSAGIKEITGLSPEELRDDLSPFVDLIRPDFYEEYFRKLQESAENLTPLSIEIPLIKKDGSEAWLRSMGRPHPRDDGAIVWDGVVMDVTEQRQIEESARQAHLWLLQAIDTMPNGFMLWDKEDRLVLWNHRVMTYHPNPTVIAEGALFEDVIGGIADDVKERFGDETANDWLAERRQRHQKANGSYECQGSVNRWYTVTEHRTPEGFTVTLTAEITNRRENEERLRESDERYRALVNLLPDAVYVHKGGYIVLSNEAALNLFGAEIPEDLMGKEALDLTHPEFHEAVVKRRSLVVSEGTRTVFMRQKRLRLDGSWFWAEVAAAAIDWEGERGGIVVMRDVTEQIKAEEVLIRSKEEAEIANRTKTEFLANISHELRTPLNAIIGFSDLMQREMFGPLGNEQYNGYVRDIHQSGSHLHDVINDILDLSKIEAGKLELSEAEVELGLCVERCLRVVAPRADDGGLKIESEIDDSLPQILADERKIKQIVINLLSNAVKFTESGGSISISVQHDQAQSIVLIVRDTGIGIAEEDLAQALMPFGQVDSTLSRRHEGTGLGLPLTKSLVELHGGTLSVDSTVGVGTSVIVRLPAWRAVKRPSAAE
jgi:PAS domain S-box-containing protein